MAPDDGHGPAPPPNGANAQFRMNGWRIASIAAVWLFMSAAGPAAAHEAPPLVEYLSNVEFDTGDLSVGQRAVLDAIRADPAATGTRIGRANAEAVREALALSLELPASPEDPAGKTASFHDLSLDERADRDYSLYFRDDPAGSEVALVVAGRDVLGTVRHDGGLYKVHPLGDALTAVYRYDTGRLPSDATGRELAAVKRQPHHPAPRNESAAATSESPVIDILVAYTRHARIQSGNIDALLRYTFEETNRTYANSHIRTRVRLVHAYQTDYTQSADLFTDLQRLVRPGDSHMDEVHRLRDEYAADLTVLLVGNPEGSCASYYIYPSEAYAFGAIARTCIGLYAFAQMLGFMQGASGDPEIHANHHFPHGHGFCNDTDNWRTVMARNRDDRCPVPIPYFSNPDVSYAGTPTGNAEQRNNARVIDETAERIAGFRDPPPTSRSFDIPLFMPADNSSQQGFVRITNRSYRAGTVSILAIDDSGERFGPASLAIGRRASAHFNSGDLEEGNPSKGLPVGVGDGIGNWRLQLGTDLDIEPRAYVRTSDGFLTSIHEVAGRAGVSSMRYHVPVFNPASNRDQQSRLRLVNPGEVRARIVINGLDDRGNTPPEGNVTLTLDAGAARTVTAQELEAGSDAFTGRFGNGSGKWQLFVSSNRPIAVMSLLQSPTGELTNLSP